MEPNAISSPVGASKRIARWLFLGAIAIIVVAVSMLVLKYAPAPFFWAWLTVAAGLFAAMFCARTSWGRAILFNLGIVACLLAGAEAYLIKHEYTPPVSSHSFIVHDALLGWAPAKNIEAHGFKAGPAGLFHGPEGVVFDATYTIDSNGLRVAPPCRPDKVAGTVLFFGCSFTFGEGLKDSETLPYQVGVQSGGRYCTVNFGFEAYGPEQMLAAIEQGRVREIVSNPPQIAYYVATPGHVWRVAGRVPWGGNAPRYVLSADGNVHQEGRLEDRKTLADRLGLHHGVRQLNKSAIWRWLSTGDARVTDEDIRLYLAVVRRSAELLKGQFPGIQFRVILWPNQQVPQQRDVYFKLRDGFKQLGIHEDLVEDILPGYATNRAPYILGPSDHHPNALADRVLAQYVLTQLEQKP